MASWRPGSYEPPWSWNDEIDDLVQRDEIVPLLADVKEHGFQEPVLLGNDGRVWDGHHRIIVGNLLQRLIPVEYA